MNRNLVNKMDEFSFINSIKQAHYRQSTLIKGIGDDTAVFRQTQNDIVTAVDTFVEGIHFSNKTMSPEQVGYRVLTANISDIAAMGARPTFYLVSIVIPSIWSTRVQRIFKGMQLLANEYEMDLIGGDTVSGEQLTISITIIGYVEQGKARYRNSARKGDVVFVTGTLGDSRAGLHILQSDGSFANSNYYIKRHQEPTPRVRFAQALHEVDRVALNDISDGIVSEAAEIAKSSKQNIVLEDELIPVKADFNQFPKRLQTEWKLYGGEDYELLGTVGQHDWKKVQEIGSETNTKVSKVGYVMNHLSENDSIGQVYLYKNGKKKVTTKRGYSHLT